MPSGWIMAYLAVLVLFPFGPSAYTPPTHSRKRLLLPLSLSFILYVLPHLQPSSLARPLIVPEPVPRCDLVRLGAVLVPRLSHRPQARRRHVCLQLLGGRRDRMRRIRLVLLVRPGGRAPHRRQLRWVLCGRPPRPRAGSQDVVQLHDLRGGDIRSFSVNTIMCCD